MSQNIGTLVTSPLRPNDSLDPIAVVFSSEGKGGHHSYATYADMLYAQANYSDRFEFGMLATIYADPTQSNNNTYQLQYNYYNTSATNSNNWVQYSGIPQTKPLEWQDSVLSRTSSIPSILSDGDRYLITGPIGGTATDSRSTNWNGHTDNIATYDSRVSFWNFTLPFEGMTVRADDEKGVIYKYTGIYGSAGLWVKEYVNQVYSLTASSNDGINFTADANLVGYYKPCVFYTQFLTASVGPNMYFNINNLGSASVVKIVGNTLQPSIAAGDFVTLLQYQLIWDGTQFQVPFNSSVTSIGNPEVGNTYSGGVYNWNTIPSFEPTTSIGTAIDRFNKILAALVPTPPSALSNMTPTGTLGQSGRLTFPGSFVNNFNPAWPTVPSGIAAVDLDGLFTTSTSVRRVGVLAATTSSTKNISIQGTLNSGASGDPSGIPNYTNSFSDANKGFLYLIVNGLTISTATLSNLGSINTTNGNTQPGFILSAATASKFNTGSPFELFWGRTGTYLIPASSYLGPYTYTASIGLTANRYGFTRGYNYVNIIQDNTSTIINVPGIDFILDDKPTTITVPSGTMNYSSGLTTYYTLSGIKYYNTLTVVYSANINNAYESVYSDGATVVISDDSTTGSVNNATPAPPTGTVNSQNIPSLSSNPSNFNSFTITTVTRQWNTTTNALRRINDSVACRVSSIGKPASSSGFTFNYAAGGGANITGLVFDNMINSNSSLGSVTTAAIEYFREESYRLVTFIPGSNVYDNTSSILNNPYNMTASLATTNTNDLQIYNGGLRYPTINYNTIGTSTYNLNNGVGASVNYNGLSGIRYYYRYFYFAGAGATYKFKLTLLSSSAPTIRKKSQSLSGNQIYVEVKLPGTVTSPLTGWLDTAEAYNTITYPNPLTDGVGCLDGSITGNTAQVGSSGYSIQIGYTGTNLSNSGGYFLMRITAPASWSGNLTQIQVTQQ